MHLNGVFLESDDPDQPLTGRDSHPRQADGVVQSSFRAVVEEEGVNPFVRVPTRVSQAFAGFAELGFWFTGRDENPRFSKIETIATNAHVHRAKIRTVDELDDTVGAWIDRAYRVGCREHLR